MTGPTDRPRVTVVRTSPRLPGLLGAEASVVLARAVRVCASENDATVAGLQAAGVDVRTGVAPGQARDGDVWLVASDEALAALSEAAEVGEVLATPEPPGAGVLGFAQVMDRLWHECPWYAAQTHDSLTRYLVEEAYEVVEAIDHADDSPASRSHLRDELGDLLLQVVFHARIAQAREGDAFDIDDVAEAISRKLVRRNPHVFAGAHVDGVADVEANWEQIKAAEQQREHPLDGIAPGLPALAYADKVVARAMRSDLVLSVPVPEGASRYDAETLGDVLFALVAAGTAAGIDPEQALRRRVQRELPDPRR